MEMESPRRDAFGHPGIPPRWTSSSKEGVGTAYSTASRVWFTLSHGILNEVYFPTVDSPQIRDLGYLVTDGESLFHEEKRDLQTRVEYLDDHALGYRVINTDPGRRYRIVKEIIADPHLPCVLIHTRLEGDEALLQKLRLYVLLAPHLEGRGWGNSARKVSVAGKDMLTACRGEIAPGPRGLDPLLALLLRLRRRERRLDRSQAGSPHGLGVRPGPRRERGGHGRARPLRLEDVHAGPRLRLRASRGDDHPAAVPGHPLRGAAREVPGPVASCLLRERAAAGGLRRRRTALSDEPQPAAGARGQELPGSPDRVAEHPLGGGTRRRGRPGRLPPRLDARHVQQRDGAAGGGVREDPRASAHLPRGDAAAERRLLPELLDRRRAVSGAACSSTRPPSR